MIQVETIKVTLPLKKTFTISQGSVEQKTNLLTILNNRYAGEAARSVYYGPSLITLEKDIHKGIAELSKLETLDIDTIAAIGEYKIHAIAKSALVAMVLHYISGETERYPWEILSLGTPVGIKTSFTIGIESPTKLLESVAQCGNPIIKIKMGSDDDYLIIDELKKLSGIDIRVDANGGWSLEKAEEMIALLEKIGVRIIEQPTSVEHIMDWPKLKKTDSEVELFVDEGLDKLSDYHDFEKYIDGINIKMEKSGGILAAKAIAEAARADGVKVMLGCMLESSVGISQSVYLSSMADYYDLDSPQHFEMDIARGINYHNEQIEVDREIIGGPKLIRDLVDRFIEK